MAKAATIQLPDELGRVRTATQSRYVLIGVRVEHRPQGGAMYEDEGTNRPSYYPPIVLKRSSKLDVLNTYIRRLLNQGYRGRLFVADTNTGELIGGGR
jgi:hypothetical protein